MDMVDYAVAYAMRGWRVFPVKPNGKFPAIPKEAGGNGVLDATTDRAQIELWWRQFPRANIGLKTGDVVVLDVDAKGDGYEFIAKYMEATPPTRQVRTPHGGMHLYFANTSGREIRNRQSVGRHSIDIRGEGGYILGPPNMVDGVRYELVANGNTIAPIPEWLTHMLFPPRRVYVPREGAEGKIGGLVNFVAAQGEGSSMRNRALFWAARKMFDMGKDIHEVASELAHVSQANGLDENEIMRTIQSAANERYRPPT